MISITTLIICICLMALTKESEISEVCAIITVFAFSIAYVFDIIHSKKLRYYSVPLFLGYFLRVIVLLYDVYSDDPFHLPLVGGELSGDSSGYYGNAVAYSNGYTIKYGGVFSKMLGTIFSITGATRLWGEFIVLLFSVLTILVTATIADELSIDTKRKQKGIYLIAVLPYYLLVSATVLRETVVSFCIAVSVLFFLRWFNNCSGEAGYIGAFVFALLASLFHGAAGLVVVAYIILRLIYNPKTKEYSLTPRNIIISTLFICVFLFVYIRYGNIFFAKLEGRFDSGVKVAMRERGGSSYARYVGDANSILHILIYTVPRYLYYMYSPFPWQWRGMSDIVAFIASSCVYLIIKISAIDYIKRTDKNDSNRKVLIALYIISIMMSVVYSWGVTNTGTAIRHRDKFIVIYIIMFMLSYSKWSDFKIGKIRIFGNRKMKY